VNSVLYELEGLKKAFDGRTVLDLEALSLQRAKVHGVLGPNGSGKTTLLEILAFLSSPSSGGIRFEGEPVGFTSSKLRPLRRKVVFVPQHPILFTTTVSKNVGFPLKIRKTPKTRRDRIVEELLELVGMGRFRQEKAHKLSGGETQRVAIARALACFPEVILLDEPTANVDVENQITIEQILREINLTRAISVIFTTHNLVQATRLADKIVFLFDGKMAESIYENIFSGSIETNPAGDKFCVLHNGIRLMVRTDKSGPIRISVDPSRVKITKNPGDTKRDNVLKGRLIQLTDEEGQVRALVDMGVPVSVLVPKEAFNNLTVGMGDEIWLTVPLDSIEVF
jgi:tungstate transport system ATP-binding protein